MDNSKQCTDRNSREQLENQEWHTGNIYLKHIQETIVLPPQVRVRYMTDAEKKEYLKSYYSGFHGNWGEVKTFANTGNGTLDMTIYCRGRGFRRIYTMGHEEGHVVDKTGNLQKLLSVAKEVGFQFDFFTKAKAKRSDQAVKRASVAELALGKSKPYNERELLADIGGLIALKKAHANQTLLEKIEESIQTAGQTGEFCLLDDAWFTK